MPEPGQRDLARHGDGRQPPLQSPVGDLCRMPLTLTRDLWCTSDRLGYLAWFLDQDTLAPAGHPAACQASYPATASLTRAGMLVGPVTAGRIWPGPRRWPGADRIVASSPYQMISVLDWGRRLGVSPIRRAAADRNVMAAGTDRRQGDGRMTGGCRPRPAGGRTIRGRRAARRRYTLEGRCRPCCMATSSPGCLPPTSSSRNSAKRAM